MEDGASYSSIPADMFASMATAGDEALSRHTLAVRAPSSTKELRKFTPPEAASWIGVTPTYLRQLHSRKMIQEVDKLPSGQRSYTADEIHEIRRSLHCSVLQSERPGGAAKYAAGKPEGALPNVVVVANFKGGVGKTSLAAHLTAYLSLRGNRVLGIDADSQGSLSHLFDTVPAPAIGDEPGDPTIYDAIRIDNPVHPSDAIYETYFPGIHICPASLDLEEFEFEMPAAMMSGALADKTPFYDRLNEVIEGVRDHYDAVVVDCPPRLSFLTIAAFSAANVVIIPCPPSMIDVHSTNKFLQMAASHIETVTERGAEINIAAARILLTKVKTNDINHAEVATFMRRTYGDAIMRAQFLESSAVSDVSKTSETLFEAPRRDFNRQTYDRAMNSLMEVCSEIEGLMAASWRYDIGT